MIFGSALFSLLSVLCSCVHHFLCHTAERMGTFDEQGLHQRSTRTCCSFCRQPLDGMDSEKTPSCSEARAGEEDSGDDEEKSQFQPKEAEEERKEENEEREGREEAGDEESNSGMQSDGGGPGRIVTIDLSAQPPFFWDDELTWHLDPQFKLRPREALHFSLRTHISDVNSSGGKDFLRTGVFGDRYPNLPTTGWRIFLGGDERLRLQYARAWPPPTEKGTDRDVEKKRKKRAKDCFFFFRSFSSTVTRNHNYCFSSIILSFTMNRSDGSPFVVDALLFQSHGSSSLTQSILD